MYRLVIMTALLALANGARLPLINQHTIGGVETTETLPYQVMLLHYDFFVCTCTIITPTRVLTPAHCLEVAMNEGVGMFAVQILTIQNNQYIGGDIIGVNEVVQHPNFKKGSVDFDIGVIKLKEPISFYVFVQPIELVSQLEEPQPGEMLIVSGREFTTDRRKLGVTVKHVRVPGISRAECQEIFEPIDITENMICADNSALGLNNGDTGNLLVNENNKLVGIGTFLQKVAHNPARRAQVFTNIASPAVRLFIDEHKS